MELRLVPQIGFENLLEGTGRQDEGSFFQAKFIRGSGLWKERARLSSMK